MAPRKLPRTRDVDRSFFTYAGLLLVCPLILQSCDSSQNHQKHQPHVAESPGHAPKHHNSPASYMKCGDDILLCGILSLESGMGPNYYKHKHPHVHGLWPQNGHYGNSKCISPSTSETPLHHVASCYHQRGDSNSHLVSFQKHEWEKHGKCAGVASASDYFSQICAISKDPLQIMEQARSSGGNLDSMVKALKKAGFPVAGVAEGTGEIHLSACGDAGHDDPSVKWKLSDPADFHTTCGHSGTKDNKAIKGHLRSHDKAKKKMAQGTAGSQMCVANQHGPECTHDDDCSAVPGCLRCANSGFCTKDTDLGKSSRATAGSQTCVANKHGPECTTDDDCAGVSGCLRCANSGFCTNVALPDLQKLLF